MVPCKGCIILPICINKEEVVCSKLFNYIEEKVIVKDKEIRVSYTKFIEAQQVLTNMNSISKGALQIAEDWP